MDEYTGIEFTPPKDTVDPADSEGEALVSWKKVGDRYTIVAFEGEPLAGEADDEGEMDSMQMIDKMYEK